MPGSWPQDEFPNLNSKNCMITSKAVNRYNCLAWAAGDSLRWWWPDDKGIGYWPANVPRELNIQAFIMAYGVQGYTPCTDGSLEPGVEKIALFALPVAGGSAPTHAALQLPNGEWTSKLGSFEDITHTTVHDVSGPVYGTVACYLSRRRIKDPFSFIAS